jgi:hypothetical protein
VSGIFSAGRPRRRPGPIPRNLSIDLEWQLIFAKQRPVVMDPGSRFACPGRRTERARRDYSFSRHEMSEVLEANRPRNQRGRRECRMRVAPVAACAAKKHRRQQPGVRRNSRHSLRNGFNGFLHALLGDHAFLPPSSADRSAHLAPASERQDHTTSPSAPTPLVAQMNCARRCASIASRSQRP